MYQFTQVIQKFIKYLFKLSLQVIKGFLILKSELSLQTFPLILQKYNSTCLASRGGDVPYQMET